MIKIWIGNAYQYREVEPLEKVTLPGYEDYEFYATNAIEPWNSGIINITEARTGEIVGSGRDIEKASASASTQLQKYTKEEINARIEKVLKSHEDEMAENTVATAQKM